MRALIDACATPDYPAEIVTVISNRADAKGLEFAKAAGLSTQIIPHKDYAERAAFEDALHAAIKTSGAELVCLAGFMRILTADFVNRWRDKLINIHPSLLPAFKGLHTHERALEAGVKFTGCTVHFVRPETDDGPIIIQAAIPVLPNDTPESLSQRVLEQEHLIYPEAVRLVASGRAKVRDRHVEIDGAEISPAPSLINPPIGS